MGGTGKKGGPAPFLLKTHQMAEDAATDDVISWTEDGAAFVVRKPVEFAKELLPLHFKHNNFSSFVRQLNTYGFRKMALERWEFTNDNFRRGQPDLLFKIKRRRNARRFERSNTNDEREGHTPSPSSSKDHEYQSFASTATTSSPPRAADSVWLENEKLKKTNKILYQELAQAKQRNEVLLGFLSKYIDVTNLRCPVMEGGGGEEGNKGPMLFGVRLKDVAGEETRKRGRCGGGDDGSEKPAKMVAF